MMVGKSQFVSNTIISWYVKSSLFEIRKPIGRIFPWTSKNFGFYELAVAGWRVRSNRTSVGEEVWKRWYRGHVSVGLDESLNDAGSRGTRKESTR